MADETKYISKIKVNDVTYQIRDTNTTYSIDTAEGNTITLTGSDGTSLTKTINNVANAASAGSATKATQDGNGNVITTTYAKKSEVPTAYIKSASASGNTLTLKDASGADITFTPETSSAVTSVNGQTGAVTLSYSDVGAQVEGSYQAAGNYVSYTQATATVAGTSKTVSAVSPNTLYVSNGLIMGGTAAAAGLTTRGICGVTTPSSTGACTKENLYLNYDGTNDYVIGRKVVLGAGSAGSALTGGAYTYCAVRGDEMVSYVTDKIKGKADTSAIPTKVSDLTNDSGFTSNVGTITEIKMNGASKGTSGVVDLGTVITSITGNNLEITTNAIGIVSNPYFDNISAYDDNNEYLGTDNFSGNDIDATYYSKGIYLYDNDSSETSEYNLSFPAKSGTFALTSDVKTYTAGSGISISANNAISTKGTQVTYSYDSATGTLTITPVN